MNKGYRITIETLERFNSYWPDSCHWLNWNCLFALPIWVNVWWYNFSNNGLIPHICIVRYEDSLIGIAPMMVQGNRARLIGSSDVCDYLDFIVRPEYAQDFFEILIEHLRQHEINRMDLGPLRADSIVFSDCIDIAHHLKCEVKTEPEDITYELELPTTWEEYLYTLSRKQRHEVRRKLRRLQEAGNIDFRVIGDVEAVRNEFNTFLTLFRAYRSDKAEFMTDQMTLFFQSLAVEMAEYGFLKLGFLDLDNEPVAAVLYFEYNATIFLYNSGYDERYGSLNVGLLSKVYSIQDGIARGFRKYDFLKGAEAYKKRLGAKPVQLLRCRIELQ